MDAAKKFIRTNKDKPFFCYLPITPPHGMFDIPDEDPAWAIYKDKPWPEKAKRYAAMVTMVDRHVGEVVALLRELGLEKDTLVMFGGDNGGMDYFKSKEHPRGFHAPNVHPKTGIEFRGQKGKLFEGGLRVPMVASWPGRIEAGRVSHHTWYFPDLFPTFAELAGASSPADIDGISIVPELFGRPDQKKHEYLYWEIGSQTAIRMDQWKAIQSRKRGKWQLFDLNKDISERHDVSAANPEVLAKMQAYAKAAHQPVREGTFTDRTKHQKDRRAKWGDSKPPRRQGRRRDRRREGKVHSIPKEGLVSRDGWKILRSSSENDSNGKVAANVIDAKPRTHWHSRFTGTKAKPPHEIVIDMGSSREVRGLIYLCRQDGGWNGTFKDCEFYVGETAADLGKNAAKPAAKAVLKKTREAQTIACPPVRGRYVLVRVLSEVNGGPHASAAELAVLGK